MSKKVNSPGQKSPGDKSSSGNKGGGTTSGGHRTPARPKGGGKKK
jgi:hypothetical protein